MQYMEFLSVLKKHGLSYAIYEISFSSRKTWTILCNFWNFFLYPKNVDYHMQFMKFISPSQKQRLSFALSGFSSTIRGLSYAISGISFSSPKTWTIICNLGN